MTDPVPKPALLQDMAARDGGGADAASAPDIRRMFAALREVVEVLETDVVRKSRAPGDPSGIEALQRRMLQVEQRLELIEKTIVAMELRFDAIGGGALPGGDF